MSHSDYSEGEEYQSDYSRSVSGSGSGSRTRSGSDVSVRSDSAAGTSDYEGNSGYKTGGYHPAHIGDVYHNGRYTIEKKLGWGHFSTVWLASDSTLPNDDPNKLVALKIQKSAVQYTEAAVDEITLLEEINEKYKIWKAKLEKIAAEQSSTAKVDTSFGTFASSIDAASGDQSFIVRLLDHFTINGPHGKHVCLVFERAGRNLLHVIKKYNYQGVPIRLVKSMTKQILAGLRFLHDECSIIHTDLKPEVRHREHMCLCIMLSKQSI